LAARKMTWQEGRTQNLSLARRSAAHRPTHGLRARGRTSSARVRHMRVVPWASWSEWASVGGALLGGLSSHCPPPAHGTDDGADEDNEDGSGHAGRGGVEARAVADAAAAACGAAASRVATWRARGRVPLAVDVTAALAEARAADSAFTGRPGACHLCARSAHTQRAHAAATEP
jgi:hypothetical protein